VLWQVTDDSSSPYPLFLLSGLAVWVFFAGSLQSASRSMVDNANLIRKTRFPRQLLPFSSLGTQLVAFAVMLVVLVPLEIVLRPEVRDTVWLAIPLSLLVVALVGGLSLAVASLNAIYRDVEHLVSALLLPWFFLTPVLYTSESLPAEGWEGLVDVLHWVNFAAPAVTAVRDPLFYGRLPTALDVIYLAGSAVLALALGAWVFKRADDRIAVEL
jgi:lipopolysaccharide transport system permease protein